MRFVRVAAEAEIPLGDMRRVEAGRESILVANVGGELFAISDTCTHRGGALSRGTILDGIVTCPRHGSRFDVRTGKSVGGPKILFFEWKTGNVRKYALKVEEGDIHVEVE